MRSYVPASHAALPRPAALALACALACQAVPVLAQDALSIDPDPHAGTVPLRALDARVRIGGERVRLPGHERMGLVGLTELVNVGGEWWVGPGVYGAATGHRGGLFVPGVEGAWSHPFNDWLAIDTGVFAGGGGGAAAPVGGGLMLRPHLDLVFRFPGFYTGPTLSKVWFPSGKINSNQVGWMLNFDSSFRYRPADFAGIATDGSATGLGFDHVDAMVTFAKPRASRTTAGAALTQRIGLVGIRAERSVDGPFWAGIESAGAASGGVAGYAEVLGTAGLRFPVVGDRLSLGVRASVGLAGGGGIDTGGGLLVKAAAGATLRLTDSLGIGAEAGVVDAPRGHYKAATGAVSLNWALDVPQHDMGDWFNTRPGVPTRMEFGSGVERYRAARKDGHTQPLDAVVLQMNRFVTPNLYVTGQAHSAFAGNAGAYSVGLFGIGAQLPLSERVRLGAEALAGAAGGGGCRHARRRRRAGPRLRGRGPHRRPVAAGGGRQDQVAAPGDRRAGRRRRAGVPLRRGSLEALRPGAAFAARLRCATVRSRSRTCHAPLDLERRDRLRPRPTCPWRCIPPRRKTTSTSTGWTSARWIRSATSASTSAPARRSRRKTSSRASSRRTAPTC